MGVTTDGEISCGIVFPDGYVFPWDDDIHEGDVEAWWRYVNGYEPPFEIDWETIDRSSPEGATRVSDYFSHKRAFDEAHPLPVELVNYCYVENPMYIVAVKGTVLTANRGYPKPVPELVRDGAAEVAFTAFVETWVKPGYEDQSEDVDEIDWEPKWWLSSYWG